MNLYISSIGTKGSKAFAYFNIIAKHWFFQKVKNSKKKNKLDVYFDKLTVDKIEKEHLQNKAMSLEQQIFSFEFHKLLQQEIKSWRGKYEKKQEKLVLEAILLILENPDIISLQNKKAIYLYLREITRYGHQTNRHHIKKV